MPESSATLLRAGGYAAFSIIPLLIASGIAFWLFLNGAGAIFGPINDLLVAVSLALLALPVLAHPLDRRPARRAVVRRRQRCSRSSGIAVAAVGQVLLVLGVIPLEASFVTGGLGILPVLVWALAVGIIAGRIDALPDQLGWVTAGALRHDRRRRRSDRPSCPDRRSPSCRSALLVTLAGWLVVIGWTCLAAADAPAVAVAG